MEIAEWMVQEIRESGELYQEVAVDEIEKLFGSERLYDNGNGNQAISKNVLASFRELTKDEVIWVRGELFWRKREDFDEPGRLQ